jgi:feruloyl esterase
MNHRIITALLTLAAATLGHAGSVAAQDCPALQKLSLPGASVTGTQAVAAGALSVTGVSAATAAQLKAAVPNLPAFCRVMITAKPSPGSDIRIEVWLPAAGWNGRLQAVGDGGLAGYIPFSLMA